MKKLTRADLMPLEDYSSQRVEFRARVMAHKKNRKLHLGENATLYFENRLTMHYQVQEMLRIERIFEAAGIEEELAAYNPLIPDGDNWKATFMLEFPDEDERREQLGRLRGVEDAVWLEVDNCGRVVSVADEDIERANETKTSAVHFMRFQLDTASIVALKSGASLSAGIDHDACRVEVNPVPAALRDSLFEDLD